jgi:hypothetical protein
MTTSAEQQFQEPAEIRLDQVMHKVGDKEALDAGKEDREESETQRSMDFPVFDQNRGGPSSQIEYIKHRNPVEFYNELIALKSYSLSNHSMQPKQKRCSIHYHQ